jgi:hypothetical protein
MVDPTTQNDLMLTKARAVMQAARDAQQDGTAEVRWSEICYKGSAAPCWRIEGEGWRAVDVNTLALVRIDHADFDPSDIEEALAGSETNLFALYIADRETPVMSFIYCEDERNDEVLTFASGAWEGRLGIVDTPEARWAA